MNREFKSAPPGAALSQIPADVQAALKEISLRHPRLNVSSDSQNWQRSPGEELALQALATAKKEYSGE